MYGAGQEDEGHCSLSEGATAGAISGAEESIVVKQPGYSQRAAVTVWQTELATVSRECVVSVLVTVTQAVGEVNAEVMVESGPACVEVQNSL